MLSIRTVEIPLVVQLFGGLGASRKTGGHAHGKNPPADAGKLEQPFHQRLEPCAQSVNKTVSSQYFRQNEKREQRRENDLPP